MGLSLNQTILKSINQLATIKWNTILRFVKILIYVYFKNGAAARTNVVCISTKQRHPQQKSTSCEPNNICINNNNSDSNSNYLKPRQKNSNKKMQKWQQQKVHQYNNNGMQYYEFSIP